MAVTNDDAVVSDARSGGVIDGTEPSDGGSADTSISGANPADGIPVKRGRGRPRKDGGAGSSGSASGDGGRKESPRASGPKASLDVDLFAQQLVGMHMIAAKLLNAPELMIGPDEAKNLAKAIQNIMKHYSINVSPKTIAMMQFMGVAAAIYAPRAIMIANRKGHEAQHKKQQNANAGFSPASPMPGAFDQPPPPQGTMNYQ